MARDLFILGCGRSGTSLIAGLFRSSGHFQGSRFYAPRESNPKGFFEDVEVNDVNESILALLLPSRVMHNDIAYMADAPGHGQRWLSRFPPGTQFSATPIINSRIRSVLARRPFCLKDPRFCYTLPLWQAHAPTARMICVFRDPRIVVASILKEVASMPYLADFALSTRAAYEVWSLMYLHVLRLHVHSGDWLFIEYNDLFSNAALDRIAEFAETTIDDQFPDPQLDRSKPVNSVDGLAQSIYEELRLRSATGLSVSD